MSFVKTFAVVLLIVLLAPLGSQALANEPTAVDGRVEKLITTLEDEAARQRLIDDLKLLIQAAEPDKPPVTDRLIATVAGQLERASGHLSALAASLADLPRLGHALKDTVAGPEAAGFWRDLGIQVALGLIAGWLLEAFTGFLLSRPRKALSDGAPDGWLLKITRLIARTVLDLLPLSVFAGAAYALGGLLAESSGYRQAGLLLILGYLNARLITTIARALFTPSSPGLRLISLKDELAGYLYVWTGRFTWVAVIGFFATEAALAGGLSGPAYGGAVRMVGLVLLAMGVLFVLQNRRAVAVRLKLRETEARAAGKSPSGSARVKSRLADVWHLLAIGYLIAVFGVWALEVEGGFAFLAKATAATVAILVVTRLVQTGLEKLIDRGFRINPDLEARFPGLETRANRYLPVLKILARGLFGIVAILAVLQAWGLDMAGLLISPGGRVFLNSASSILIVLIITLLIWEGASAAIQRYLEANDGSGHVVERSARARTLLPLLRNALMVLLSVMTTLIILSELGVDIGPLLAGAGVIGLAIGFGSQKLVQDVITGGFLLLEDALQVGDVVTLAGNTGVVERLSIRSIRLRDVNGDVFNIPFSAVDTVINMTKEFSFAVVDVGVAYREDTDVVTAVLRDIGTKLQEDPEWGPLILEELEVLGVDALADSAVVIKVRFKTVPAKQFPVRREFNRRVKKRFDELGIEIPFPHTTLYFGVDQDGNAPPAQVLTLARKPKAQKGEALPEPDAPQGPREEHVVSEKRVEDAKPQDSAPQDPASHEPAPHEPAPHEPAPEEPKPGTERP
ncbi:MAG: mechanosensitive ion channel domain-containing protein [Rhodospirillales bacterium]